MEVYPLTCPKCDATIKAYMSKCPKCGLPLTYNDKVGTEDKLPVKTIALRALLVALGVLVTLSVITFIVMRIYYARTNERITKEYVKQVIETITLENGTQGHALTFFGKDGDCISKAWENYFQNFLPQSGLESKASPDFEIYFDDGDPDLMCEFWIPVKNPT